MMKTRLEVIVPKSDSNRVLKAMVLKLTEMGVKLVPLHRGSKDNANKQDSLVYCEVPDDFDGAQDITNALYSVHAISSENVVRKRITK